MSIDTQTVTTTQTEAAIKLQPIHRKTLYVPAATRAGLAERG